MKLRTLFGFLLALSGCTIILAQSGPGYLDPQRLVENPLSSVGATTQQVLASGTSVCSGLVAGTYSGTVVFEQSSDGGNFFSAFLTPNSGGNAVSSTTGQFFGWFTVQGGTYFRLRMSTYVSGTATAGVYCVPIKSSAADAITAPLDSAGNVLVNCATGCSGGGGGGGNVTVVAPTNASGQVVVTTATPIGWTTASPEPVSVISAAPGTTPIPFPTLGVVQQAAPAATTPVSCAAASNCPVNATQVTSPWVVTTINPSLPAPQVTWPVSTINPSLPAPQATWPVQGLVAQCTSAFAACVAPTASPNGGASENLAPHAICALNTSTTNCAQVTAGQNLGVFQGAAPLATTPVSCTVAANCPVNASQVGAPWSFTLPEATASPNGGAATPLVQVAPCANNAGTVNCAGVSAAQNLTVVQNAAPAATTPVNCAAATNCPVNASQVTSPWVVSTPSSGPAPTATAGAALPANGAQVFSYNNCVFPAGGTPNVGAGNAIAMQCTVGGNLQVNIPSPSVTIPVTTPAPYATSVSPAPASLLAHGYSAGGATAPVICTHTALVSLVTTQATETLLVASAAGKQIYVCSIVLQGAASAGTGAWGLYTSATNVCGSETAILQINSNGANQFLTAGSGVGVIALAGAGLALCFNNPSATPTIANATIMYEQFLHSLSPTEMDAYCSIPKRCMLYGLFTKLNSILDDVVRP